MNVIYNNAIGNHYKKENIYLCTVMGSDYSLLLELKEQFKDIPDSQLKILFDNGFITAQQYDIFYKNENGFTRFLEEGFETFKGDNSDGKGFVENVVPVWDYYKEDELFEGIVNGNLVIVATSMEPLERYNEDYNLENSSRKSGPRKKI